MLDIKVVRPQTPKEVESLRADIESLIKLYPTYSKSFISDHKQWPWGFTLFYHLGKPIAMIELWDSRSHESIGKDALRFGGCVVPEYREHNITLLVSPPTIKQALIARNKKKVIAYTSDENKASQRALSALGFKRIGRNEHKHLMYKLDRNECLNLFPKE